jgi:hypothetical protein
MPEGCESVVSQMADRVLARVPGRCIADGEGPIRYAAASVISSN